MIYLVSLPNPVHGMSVVNESVVRDFAESDDLILNLVPSVFANYFPSKAWVLLKSLWQVRCLLLYTLALARGHRRVYFSIAGGSGQIFDVVYAGLGWVVGADFIVHHHSYAYIRRPTFLSKWLIRILRNHKHIVLADEMKAGLSGYGVAIDDIHVFSNTTFIDMDEPVEERPENDCLNCLFLSNVTIEKGVMTFIEACSALAGKTRVKAVIAGPISDSGLKVAIERLCNEQEHLSWVGPVYGVEKKKLFLAADVFLFPSSYANEAEPLVVHEAAQAGCMLVTSDVGCLPSVVGRYGGACLQGFVPQDYANAALSIYSSRADALQELRDAVERSIGLRSGSRETFTKILNGD